MRPSYGGSRMRSNERIFCSVTPSSENSPPCRTSTVLFTKWHNGRRQNASLKSSYNDLSYFAVTSPSNLDREASSVHEVAVEEVGVLFGGQPVDLEDIQQVVVLPMDVAADRDLRVCWELDLHQCGLVLQHLDHVEDDLIRVLCREILLPPLPLHESLAELRRQLPAQVDRASVGAVDLHPLQVNVLTGVPLSALGDRLREELLLEDLLALPELVSGIWVFRRQRADLIEILLGLLDPSQR
mmetsp:Transcript_50289/g.141370  ORF Transcript_50289/g.141370 Transcript_50289/m.141370 type:complete len:241 (+) Transcript_50289:74-796(+)